MTGRPSATATRIPTWNPPLSADSLPKTTRSNGPPKASWARIASAIAAAVETGSHSEPSGSGSTAPEAPRRELRALDRELRWQVGHQEVLPNRRSGAGRRHVRTPALRVEDRAPIWRQDGLAAQHVALDPARRRRVVHGERAQDRDGFRGPLLLVGRLAHEIGVLDARPGHARLDEVEVELPFRALGAAALPAPGGHGA